MVTMEFEKDDSFEKYGKIFGFLSAYFVFSTILFLIMKYSGSLPGEWTYFHLLAVTVLLVLFGYLIKRLLK